MNTKDLAQLHKDIEKAFDFYPFKFDAPEKHGDWVVGPTFIVRAPGFEGKERPRTHEDSEEWTQHVRMSTQSLIKYAPPPGKYSLDGQRQKHGDKCSGRFIRNASGEPISELAFQLCRLAYKHKVDQFALTEGGIFYAYSDGEPVAIFRVKEKVCQTVDTKKQ